MTSRNAFAAWQSGGGGLTSAWTKDVDEAGTALTNWVQNAGVWTASAAGLQSDSGTGEAYLMYALAGVWAQDGQAAHAIQADIAFTAASTATTDVGFVIVGANAGGGGASGNIRAFFRRNGQQCGVDVAQASLLVAQNPGLADVGVGPFTTFKVEKHGRDFDVSINGKLILSATIQGGGSINDQAWGLWANPSHVIFKNIKHWTLTPP